MKKLFISQPMRGRSDEDILAEREKAIHEAEEMLGEPVEVIDSFFQAAPVDAKPLWFLGKSLELLAGADIATVPYKVIEQMTKHPLTDQGIAKFQADYKAVFGE